YNTTTRPTTANGWLNDNRSSTNNVFGCGTCHPGNGDPTVHHLNGPAAANGTAAEVVISLPFSVPAGAARPDTVTRGTNPLRMNGAGYIYSSGTACDTYCHSDGRGNPPKNIMNWAKSTTSCGNC